jgi:hypothetical protein
LAMPSASDLAKASIVSLPSSLSISPIRVRGS